MINMKTLSNASAYEIAKALGYGMNMTDAQQDHLEEIRSDIKIEVLEKHLKDDYINIDSSPYSDEYGTRFEVSSDANDDFFAEYIAIDQIDKDQSSKYDGMKFDVEIRGVFIKKVA